MPIIKPFNGWRYRSLICKDPAALYAPPYDIIPKKLQNELYKRSPYNVVRLELGKIKSHDTQKENRYSRAARTLEAWKRKNVLVRETHPAIYVYAQDYKEGGKVLTRLGFLAAMKIDERAVLKHEKTLAAPKRDRLKLLKKVRMNLSPIFGLFQDPTAKVRQLLRATLRGKPQVDVRIDGVRHRLYAETRPAITEALCRCMASKPMFIADGHHRFEVSCQYRRFRNRAGSKGEIGPWNYVMTYFADCGHNPFAIYPTHRLIRLRNKAPVKPLLEKMGKVERVADLKSLLGRLSKSRLQERDGLYRFGWFTKKEGFLLLKVMPSRVTCSQDDYADKLDVAVLHQRILEPFFGIKHVHKSEHVDFTRSAEEAWLRVRSGEFDAAVFLRPTALEEVIEASRRGLKMPQKSTYFYPKLLSGLVFYGFEHEESPKK